MNAGLNLAAAPRPRPAAHRAWRLGARLPHLGALAIESRAHAAAPSFDARARHAAWVAANALAACGRWVTSAAAPAGVLWLADREPAHLLAVIAAGPALPALETQTWAERAVLRALGVPGLRAGEVGAALAAGVRIVVADLAHVPAAPLAVARVADQPTGYHVAFDRPAPPPALAAACG